MRLKPEQLSQHLQQGLKPYYIITGDDPLLAQEINDQIRRVAKANGFDEREIHHADHAFDWNHLLESANALSLFTQRKIHELRIENGKPGDKGSKAVLTLLEQPNPDNLIVLILPRVDKAIQNSKWFKSIDKVGAIITHWPIERHQLPGWFQNRLKQNGMRADSDALNTLAERTDGNLLAAAQEVEKLKLIGLDRITLKDVDGSVGDAARYDIFALSAAALKGESARALRIVDVLKGEGINALQPLAILSNDIRQLHSLVQLTATGMPVDKALQQLKVNWPQKQRQLKAAASRHTIKSVESCMTICRQIDLAGKGLLNDDPWRVLSELILGVSGLSFKM